MTINPPSDIVLGVARAADPLKYQAAADRLARLSGTASSGGGASSASWTSSVQQSTSAATVELEALHPSPVSRTGRLSTQVRSRPDAFSQFEAFVLQSFVQSMLPKQAKSVFGRGTAGEIWKSMLAEKLASEMARSGKVGIAKQIATGAGEALANRPVPAMVDAPSNPIRPAASLLSYLPYLQNRFMNVADDGGSQSTESQSAADRS